MKIKMVSLPVFVVDVVVALGATREDILDYFKKKFKEGSITEGDKEKIFLGGVGRTIRLESSHFIIWTKHYPDEARHFATLQHEIFHVADLALRYRGLKLSDDSDETWAYVIDYLTNLIYNDFELIPMRSNLPESNQKKIMASSKKPAAKPAKKPASKKK